MTIYEIDGDGTSPLEESPYEQEAELQDLIARNPGILAGDNPSDNERWLLVDTEVGLGDADGAADRWYVDNLYSGWASHASRGQDGLQPRDHGERSSGRCSTMPPTLSSTGSSTDFCDTLDARCRNQGLSRMST